MTHKKISKGLRKRIREEKARIRHQFRDAQEIEKHIEVMQRELGART